MRVLLIGSAGIYGAQISLLYLAKHLANKGADVMVVIPEHGVMEKSLKKEKIKFRVIRNGLAWTPEYNQLKIYVVRFIKKILNIAAEIRICLIIKKQNIDIVHINSIGVSVGAWSAKLLKRKLVWHIREFVEEDLNRKFYNRCKVIKNVNRADEVIAISQAIYNKYCSDITVKQFKIILNGIELKEYYCARNIMMSGRKINIVFIGRICREKGQRDLIEALPFLQEIKERIYVSILGDGNGFNEEKVFLENAVKKYGWKDRVNFAGYIQDIPNILKNADICIVGSRKEAFGRVTAEAFMSGCAVIGANTGGTLELIGQSQNRGYLYEVGNSKDLADKIMYVIEHKDEVFEIIKNAQDYALKYLRAETNAENIYRCYEEILEEKKG